MPDCDYCDEDFSSKREQLKHELDEHGDEMSGHDKSDKKSELNKLEQKQQTNKHRRKKQLKFSIIAVLFIGLVAAGGYWGAQNTDFGSSQTTNKSAGIGTPVHWHADYQITVCGEEKVLQGGPKKAHTHGEKTFHLEGVRTNREQATLDWTVDQLGGQLEGNSIMGKDSCNGEAANLTVKVNENEVEDHLNYIPRDGDFIRIDYS